MTESIAMYMARLLAEAGIERIWGITGDSLNGLNDSLTKLDQIKWVGTRHEETAAFAAGADAAITGRLAVCAGSCGPGNLHLINGLFDCQRNHVPVLAIASHIPSNEIGSNYFQETHPQELFKECSVYCELISSPEQMPYVLHTAMRQAVLKKGVAVVVISGDTMLKPMPEGVPVKWQEPQTPVVVPPHQSLVQLADQLNDARRITLLCGAGCQDAMPQVLDLAGRLKSPIVHALRGKEWVEPNNPYDVGMTGLIGFASGYHAMRETELLLVLGSAFPYREFYPDTAKIVQIDVNSEALGVHAQIDTGLIGDIKNTLLQLLPLIEEQPDRSFLDKALEHYRKSRKGLDDLASGKSSLEIIHPQYLTRLLSEKAADDAIFTCDVGTPTVWAARYIEMTGKRRLLGSFNHGSMANAMPQAIGAQAVDPRRQVVAMCGDGGFSMLMGDILTVRQHQLPLKIVVYNNRSLGFVALEMKAGGYLDDNTELENPDFAAIAKAMGIRSLRIDDPKELEAAVEEFLSWDGPALLDVSTARQELSMPPKISMSHAKGFGLYMLRAIINGKGDKVVELAKENILR